MALVLVMMSVYNHIISNSMVQSAIWVVHTDSSELLIALCLASCNYSHGTLM